MVEEAAVVVPFYKNDLNIFEQVSYDQCKKILHRHQIIFVIPECLEMKLTEFPERWSVVKVPDKWMENVEAYNQMMLNKEFYECFRQYKYILIYQLDAYVFSDRLLEFCNYGYDYIGAPWIEGKFEEKIGKRIFYVGNGGFSLRKVNSCLQCLENIDARQIEYNEDLFWASREGGFKIAPKEVAWQFAFERPIKELFQLNGGKLPFGCHAWMKYDFEFLRPYMIRDGHRIIKDIIYELQWDKIHEYISQKYLIAPKNIVWESIIENCTVTPKIIWIYGAGAYGERCGQILNMLTCCKVLFADKDKRKWGQHMRGILITSPAMVKMDDQSLVIVAMKHSEQVVQDFINKGFDLRKNLILFRTLVGAINKKMECDEWTFGEQNKYAE